MRKKEIIEVEDGREFTSRTIVGGRPRAGRRSRLSIHAGIEKALYKAAVEPDFRRELLDDRFAAIRSRGIGLTEAEAVILASVSGERLALMIDQIRPERHGKRRFMRAVATAVVTLATGTAAMSCDRDVTADAGNPDVCTGIGPDVPWEVDTVDTPDDIPDIPDMEADVEDAAPEADADDPDEEAEDAPGDEEEAD